MVKWHQYSSEVDYHISILSVTRCFFNVAYKNYKHTFNFAKVIN